jgi:hypothetical protein
VRPKNNIITLTGDAKYSATPQIAAPATLAAPNAGPLELAKSKSNPSPDAYDSIESTPYKNPSLEFSYTAATTAVMASAALPTMSHVLAFSLLRAFSPRDMNLGSRPFGPARATTARDRARVRSRPPHPRVDAARASTPTNLAAARAHRRAPVDVTERSFVLVLVDDARASARDATRPDVHGIIVRARRSRRASGRLARCALASLSRAPNS